MNESDKRENRKAYMKQWTLKNKDRLSSQQKNYYQKHKERIKLRVRQWAKRNRDKCNASNRKWISQNLEHVRERNKKWSKANPQKSKSSNQKWRNTNREKSRKSNRKWSKANRARINARRLKWWRENLHFRIRSRLGTRVSGAVRRQSTQKAKSTITLLGCSIASFRVYIESKFEPGMTWDNIHLDHIIPCALFDLTRPEHQKVCFHFSNYQPLFATDNHSKGARLFHSPDHLSL